MTRRCWEACTPRWNWRKPRSPRSPAALAACRGMPFSPDYVRIVLNENFEDAKTLLLDPMMALHEGHLVMLAERGIVSRDDARKLRDALKNIDLAGIRAARYTGACEDLFFHFDGLIAAACGKDVAGR